MKDTSVGKKKIQSVERAIQILEFIAKNKNSAGLTQISLGVGLGKSTVHNLISTLEQLGYVYQDQTSGLYQLGLKLFEMGQVVQESMDLRTIAYPFLVKLSEEQEETVHLAVLSGTDIVYIDKVNSSNSVRIISQVGGRNPAYCTAAGKVLLSDFSNEEVERLIREQEMKQLTPHTIHSMVKLKKALQEVRTTGYAFDLEEIALGLRCIAAPIKNHQKRIVAAISLSGPTVRITDEKLKALGESIRATALAISANLGYRE